jgi:hypothetical protein
MEQKWRVEMRRGGDMMMDDEYIMCVRVDCEVWLIIIASSLTVREKERKEEKKK